VVIPTRHTGSTPRQQALDAAAERIYATITGSAAVAGR
jgi:hypothetical protein